MVRRAKSQLEKDYTHWLTINNYMSSAVSAHQAQKKQALKDQIGLHTLCSQYSELCFEETGMQIKLNHMTLKQHSEGGTMSQEANQATAWLTADEETTIIEFIKEMASCGFPYSHKWTKEVVDMIASTCHSNDFPEHGIGINCGLTGLESNTPTGSKCQNLGHSKISVCALETWPTTNSGGNYSSALSLSMKLSYGLDEVGIQACGHGEKEHVFGLCMKEVPYQQHLGTCKNITVICTICADGSTIPPAVIFKGSTYNVKWGENNPLKVSFVISFTLIINSLIPYYLNSLGFKKKGWTNSKIGIEWMKILIKLQRQRWLAAIGF